MKFVGLFEAAVVVFSSTMSERRGKRIERQPVHFRRDQLDRVFEQHIPLLSTDAGKRIDGFKLVFRH